MCVVSSSIYTKIKKKREKNTNGVYVQVNGNKSKTENKNKEYYSYIINTGRPRGGGWWYEKFITKSTLQTDG